MRHGSARCAFIGLLVGALSTAVVSCGDSGDTSSAAPVNGLRVDLIRAALDEVHATGADALGYFEVNATNKVVNLFVATDLDGIPNSDGKPDAVEQFVYLPTGELQGPAEPLGANGPTFAADEVDFDAERVLEKVLTELPTSTPSMFVITSAGSTEVESDRVEYRVTLLSGAGGELSVLVSGSGEVIGTDAG